MKHAQIRYSEELNAGKWSGLVRLVEAYADQKNRFLRDYSHIKFLDALKDNRTRDSLVREGFASPCGLKARAWKMALDDALGTMDRHWKATFEQIKKHVYAAFADEQERHYVFWILKNYRCVQCVMEGRIPGTQPKTVNISEERRMQITRHLRRTIRRNLGKRPTVNLRRSMALDADMYRAFEEGGRQYIAVTGLGERGRNIIPLKGRQTIKGNIRLILNRDAHTVEIHVVRDFAPDPAPEERVVAGDFGQTELLTTSDGNRYGPSFGADLKAYADTVDMKGRQRNKIYAFEKSNRTTNPAKAQQIRRSNLGKAKWNHRKTRALGRIKTNVNTAINQFIRAEKPSLFIHEDLTNYNPPFGKGIFSRLMSFWMRSVLSDRVPFMLQAGGSGSHAVNPAYSSQTCPTCGYVDKKNRSGDRFQCQNPDCPAKGMVLDADAVGARNLKARKDDPEIHLWTSKQRIHDILVKRFEARRLEGKAASTDPTVPARTPDTVPVHGGPSGERTHGMWAKCP